MTENEAKLKWCPMLIFNMGKNVKNPCCIASDCMMWRWKTGQGYEREKGYCGLGGRL